jgi:hypothetical protein
VEQGSQAALAALSHLLPIHSSGALEEQVELQTRDMLRKLFAVTRERN